MLQFATKLLMSGQLKFEEGQITIFDQRVLIFPMAMVKLIIEKCIKDKKFATSIYESAKQAVVDFSKDVGKRLNIKDQKGMLDILFKLTEMNGYGQIQPIKIDYDKKFGILHLRGLPSKSLNGKFKDVRTADVYWCGLVAGGMTYVLGTDVDAVETRCVIDGKESCEIVAGKRDYLLKTLKENKLSVPSYLK